MSNDLVRIINDDKLREEVKPKGMNEVTYQTLVIRSFNKCKNIEKEYSQFKRRLKAYIVVDNMARVGIL